VYGNNQRMLLGYQSISPNVNSPDEIAPGGASPH